MRRRLKIAWTVFFAVLTVALCVLWVRSYWKADCVARFDATQVRTALESYSGRIVFSQIDYSKISPVPMTTHDWRWEGNRTIAMDEPAPTGPSLYWSAEQMGLAVGLPHWFAVL